MLDIDELWLTDTVQIAKISKENDVYNKPSYAAPILVTQVRFDDTHTYDGSGNNQTLNRRGTVFIYPKHSKGFPELSDEWLNSKLYFDGEVYFIKEISKKRFPTSSDIFCYEIGVI